MLSEYKRSSLFLRSLSDGEKKSFYVTGTRSATLDPSISTEQSFTSCLHLTLFTNMLLLLLLLLFHTGCLQSNPTETDDPLALPPDPVQNPQFFSLRHSGKLS